MVVYISVTKLVSSEESKNSKTVVSNHYDNFTSFNKVLTSVNFRSASDEAPSVNPEHDSLGNHTRGRRINIQKEAVFVSTSALCADVSMCFRTYTLLSSGEWLGRSEPQISNWSFCVRHAKEATSLCAITLLSVELGSIWQLHRVIICLCCGIHS